MGKCGCNPCSRTPRGVPEPGAPRHPLADHGGHYHQCQTGRCRLIFYECPGWNWGTLVSCEVYLASMEHAHHIDPEDGQRYV